MQLCPLTNANGLIARITNHGAIVTELHVPDREGRLADVVLGFNRLDGYLAGHPDFAQSSGASPTASRTPGSRSTARATRWRRTTHGTTCTAG